jgi:RNA polymerase sigma factor (sigma-70 family)
MSDVSVEAFGEWVERYHNLVTAIAYSRTGDRAISEDIAQETFLVAWSDASRIRDPNKLPAWLCGIARNLAGKTLRRRRREDTSDELDARAARDSGPLSALISRETEASVWAALEKLPPAYREPLVLFYREDRSIKQVAEGLGLSEDTAKQRLSRGRVSLKANLDLVEQTVAAGRPRKAAVAAVLAALALTAKTTPAVAAPKPVRWKLAAVAVLAAASIATGVIVVVTRSNASTAAGGPRDQLAQLQRARAAVTIDAPKRCELHGSVLHSDGTPAAGVLVAAIAHDWQASALEPMLTQSDQRGRWTLAIGSGSSTISVTNPGERAQARIVTCTLARVDPQLFVLDAAGTTLRGSISDVGGGPIAGATIWLTQPQLPDVMFVTRSDASGGYELRVHPGAYTLLLRHPDYTLDVRPIAIGTSAAREDFALLPAASIEGVVVDTSGAPVPAARIHFAPTAADSPWLLASSYGGMLPHVSDASGRFVIRGVPPGSVKLSARTATLVTAEPTVVDVALAETKANVTVTVGAARTISGFIVDGKQGLAGVRVAAMREQTPVALPVVTATDSAGHFELAGLAAGSYRITAIGAGYVPYFGDAPIVVADRNVADQVIELKRGVTLRGRVEPAGPVVVTLAPADAKDAKDSAARIRAALVRAEVDDRGNFVLAGVPPGRYVINAAAYDRGGELAVTVATTDQPALHIALQPRTLIRGVVVDDRGKPLAGALVDARPTPAQPFSLSPPVRTDERGAFELVAVAGARYDARVFDARGQRAWAGDKRPFAARELTPGTNHKLVVASGGGRIAGVVIDADHKPVADAWIVVRARDARHQPLLHRAAPIATDTAGRFVVDGVFGAELVVEATKGSLRASAAARAGTDVTLELAADSMLIGEVAGTPALDVVLRSKHTKRSQLERVTGSFRIAATPGDYELVVTGESGYLKRDITIGATPTRVDVVLAPWASVRGKVVGSDGKPWANASITVQEYVDLSTHTRTDATGSFTIDRMIAGRNTIRISNAGIRQTSMVEIDLTPGQQLDLETIEGRTLDPDSKDVGAIVRALEPQTTASTSVDLGLQFFVAVDPPSAARIAQVARDPLLAYRDRSDPKAALWIVAVTPDGPGARAGLRRGDRVIAVGTRKTGTGQAAADAGMSLSTRWRSRGRAVPWTVMRDGHELAVDVLVPD